MTKSGNQKDVVSVPWSVAEKARLVEMSNAGASHRQIYAAFPDRSSTAVSSARWKLVIAGDIAVTQRTGLVRTPELDARFKKAVAAGARNVDLVKMFGGSRTGIERWKRAIKLGIGGRTVSAGSTRSGVERLPWAAEEDATLRKLSSCGYTTPEIEPHLPGRSRIAIGKRLARFGLITRQSQLGNRSPEERARLDELFTRAVMGGFDVLRLCEVFNMGHQAVSQWKRRLGLPTQGKLDFMIGKNPGEKIVSRRCSGFCGKTFEFTQYVFRCDACKSQDVCRGYSIDAPLAGVSFRG